MKLWKKILRALMPAIEMLGQHSWFEDNRIHCCDDCCCVYTNDILLKIHTLWLSLLFPIIGCWRLGRGYLKSVDKSLSKLDALNIMMSAINAGESIMQSIAMWKNA